MGKIPIANPSARHARPPHPPRAAARRGLHGYAIAQTIHLLSDEVLKVEEGSLYPAPLSARARRRDSRALGSIGEQPPRQVLRDHAAAGSCWRRSTDLDAAVLGRRPRTGAIDRNDHAPPILELFRRRLGSTTDLEAELAFHREMSGQCERQSHPARQHLANHGGVAGPLAVLGARNPLATPSGCTAHEPLARSRALVTTALLSFGLGIGVNAVVFSLAVELLSATKRHRRVVAGIGTSWQQRHSASRRSSSCAEWHLPDVLATTSRSDEIRRTGAKDGRSRSSATTTELFATLGIPVAIGRGIPALTTLLMWWCWATEFVAAVFQ